MQTVFRHLKKVCSGRAENSAWLILVPRAHDPFWSAPGIETSGRDRSRKSANHGLPASVPARGFCAQPQKFETITVTIGYKNGQLLRLRVTWPLPEVSIPGADQKDCGLWGRE